MSGESPARTHVGTTFEKKKPPEDGNTLDRERRVGGLVARKLCGQADIFPIRLELMYRQYYDDASKAT